MAKPPPAKLPWLIRSNIRWPIANAHKLVGRDGAIDALVDALAESPEHELEGWQRGNRLGLRILCELGRRYPGIVQATGPVRRKSA